MIRPIRTIALAALAAAALATGVQAQEQPQGKVKATHGAWQVRCADEPKVCIMSQIGKDAQGKDVLEVQIRRLEGAKAQDGTPIPAAMQIVTPLGVALQAGVRVQVDSKKERAAPYETCAQGGCIVRQPISSEFVEELKGGSKAKLKLVAMPQKEVPVDISLSGFTKAFNDLN